MWEREIRLGSQVIRYTIRRSQRARRMGLRVLPGKGLEVVLPRGVALREATALVVREQDWVLMALARMDDTAAAEVTDGSPLPYLGGSLRLQVVLADGRLARIQRQDKTLIVALPEGMTLPATVETWYRAEARRVIAERAAVHAAALGVTFGRITIKDTRTRWGSCSTKRNLNFSWRLLLAPFEVLDYVVAHEVAHLCEMNHSPRFWQLVESLCAEYGCHRAWLRENGGRLAAWPGGRQPGPDGAAN